MKFSQIPNNNSPALTDYAIGVTAGNVDQKSTWQSIVALLTSALLKPQIVSSATGSIAVTPNQTGLIIVDHAKATWGFAGATYIEGISVPSGLTKVAEIQGYVTGGDTVGRQMNTKAIFSGAVPGTTYTFNPLAVSGSSGGGPAGVEKWIAEVRPYSV